MGITIAYATDALSANESNLTQNHNSSMGSMTKRRLLAACDVDDDYLENRAIACAVIFFISFVTIMVGYGKTMMHGICDTIFREVDCDSNGTVDENELYTAILLVYIKINKMVRINPPSRKKVLKKFKGTVHLDHRQFREVMWGLVKHTFTRIFCVMGVTLACPVVSPMLVDAAIAFNESSGLKAYINQRLSPCQRHMVELAVPEIDIIATMTSVALVTIFLPAFFDIIDKFYGDFEIKTPVKKKVPEMSAVPHTPLERSSSNMGSPSHFRKVRKLSAHATGVHHLLKKRPETNSR